MSKQLVIITFIFLLFFLFHKSSYQQKTSYQELFSKYQNSQWVNPSSKTPIGDDELYVFAGISYLKGTEPSTINPEMPPLGKYLIGLITEITGNKNLSGFIFGYLSLVIFYLLVYEIFKKHTVSFLLSLLLFAEPIFREQLTTSLLDLPQLFFLLLTSFGFLKSFKNKWWNIICGISLGAVLSTKVFFVGILASLVLLITSFLFKKSKKELLVILMVGFITYALSYFSYFSNGHSLREFFGLHKYIINFYKSSLVSVFWSSPFYVLLFDRWETWFGKWFGQHSVIFAPGWLITWPILTLLYLWQLWGVISGKIRKIKREIFLLFLWVSGYLLFLFNTPIWSRYFLLLLPFLYILAANFFLNFKYQTVKFSIALLTCLVIAIFFWYLLSGGNNFLFTSSMAFDWYQAQRIYEDKSLLTVNPLSWPYYLLLTILYLIFDGYPSGIWLAILITSGVISILVFKVFKNNLVLLIIFLLILIYLAWRYDVFVNREKSIFLNKMLVVRKITAESNNFGVYIFNKKSDYSYPFLLHWYGVRKNNVNISDINTTKPETIYLIFEDYEMGKINSKEYLYAYYGWEKDRTIFPFGTMVIKREL